MEGTVLTNNDENVCYFIAGLSVLVFELMGTVGLVFLVVKADYSLLSQRQIYPVADNLIGQKPNKFGMPWTWTNLEQCMLEHPKWSTKIHFVTIFTPGC